MRNACPQQAFLYVASHSLWRIWTPFEPRSAQRDDRQRSKATLPEG